MNVKTLPDLSSSNQIRLDQDPNLDAWILHFMTENNLEYLLDPHDNASPEQLRFMVALDEDQLYAPCSDELFHSLLQDTASNKLLYAYNTTWRVLDRLVSDHISDPFLRRKIIQFAQHRFDLHVSSGNIIPSRLMKRLSTIFLTQSGLVDPYRERKKYHNARAQQLIDSERFDELVNYCDEEHTMCGRLGELRWVLDSHELKRLFILSSWGAIWHGGESGPSKDALAKEISKECRDFHLLDKALKPDEHGPKTILYLPRSSGAILFDILAIRALLRQGHKVILALKEAFHFQAPTFWDATYDPILREALKDAMFLHNSNMTKNDLLQALRENHFVVISDGTTERLNLYRVSVTFARAWKESDLIIAKGESNTRRLIMTEHTFTRDILCFTRGSSGDFQLHFKPKADSAHKFSESDLRGYADELISGMRKAKAEGNSIMFYSAVIGSIPGQTKVAIKVLNAIVKDLRDRLDSVYIINPAEHFIPGMDGDDLMYMWERVQRSGLINIWRFQSSADIERSFELMGEKVPPAWAGKDSTYSTGCTKEMHIALDMQKQHPELQILGPSPEKFFRRREYGVGKYFDAGIEYQ